MIQTNTYHQVLDEFRADIFQRLSIIVPLCGVITGLLLVFFDPLPHQFVLALQIFSAFVLHTRYLSRQRPNLARYLFVSSLYIMLAVSLLILPLNWIPFLVAPLLFISDLLTPWLTIIAAVLFVSFASVLVYTGYANYSIQALVLFTLLVFVVSNGSLQTIWTMLNWYRSMFDRSSSLLEETRTHRAE